MPTFKVTVLSSSSSICGKSYLLVDKWVRRIKSTSCKSITSSSISTKRSPGVRGLMDTERTASKGPMSIIGQKKKDGLSFGLIKGGAVNRGLGQNWRSYDFYMTSSWATTVTTSIFIVAAITDWLDGYLARKMRLGSAFGAFLDPVADELMVAATLVLLCTRPLEVAAFGQVPWLLPVPAIAIIVREDVAVNNLGKWKTATQMMALTILLASRDSSLSGSGALVGVALLYISAGLAVWSLAVYMKNIWRIMVKL